MRRPSRLPVLVAIACAACASAGAVVQAPSANDAPAASRAPPAPAQDLTACALPWNLDEVAGGPGRVVVVCDNDVRRQEVEPGAMMRALGPALEAARQRVCACASRLPRPAFVDLVVTSHADEGTARVEASEPDEELDPAVAPAFVACVGVVSTTFARVRTTTCGDRPATFVYPVHVELGPQED